MTSLDRQGIRSGKLIRRSRFSWVLVLIGGVILFELVRHALVATQNPSYLPALILLGAAVTPVAFVAFVFERDLPFDVSAAALMFVALVGGVIGVVTAGTLECRTLRDLGTLPMIAVAVIEESAKLLLPLAALWPSRHRRHPADGLLLGVAAGAGFAVLETMGYAFVVLIQSQGSLAAVDGLLIVRGLLSPCGHMAWTGLTAAALWRAANERSYLWRFAGVFVVAIALHTIWDSVASTSGYVVVAAISLILILVTVHRLSSRLRTA